MVVVKADHGIRDTKPADCDSDAWAETHTHPGEVAKDGQSLGSQPWKVQASFYGCWGVSAGCALALGA